MARSRALLGPYELHPDVHILSARQSPDVALQRAGHADLVETQSGGNVHGLSLRTAARNRGRCTLGRETAIQPMTWSADGWLRTTTGEGIPIGGGRRRHAGLTAQPHPPHLFARSSTEDTLPIAFQWLRSPSPGELFSVRERKGHLRLYGRETIGSLFRQALVARRQQSHCYSASTIVEFEPEHFQQMAGLVCYYNSSKFHYFYVSRDEDSGKHVRVMSALPDQVTSDAFTPPIAIAERRADRAACRSGLRAAAFAYRMNGASVQWLPQQFDASILSDEASAPGLPNFTGAFVGMACQDLAGTAMPADFDWFEYREREYVSDLLRMGNLMKRLLTIAILVLVPAGVCLGWRSAHARPIHRRPARREVLHLRYGKRPARLRVRRRMDVAARRHVDAGTPGRTAWSGRRFARRQQLVGA
jgi:xylan 1,4-beta-xylosidase